MRKDVLDDFGDLVVLQHAALIRVVLLEELLDGLVDLRVEF